jgi:pilus assembly protein FimV
MSRKLISLGVLSLILAPGAALSLGLGDIRLDSYLNQPMNAQIALSVSPGELETLRVELASPEAFERAGLDRPEYFGDLRFQVNPTGPTSATVQVSSTRPVVEPFLTFLVEARWSGGRVLREYTVLLDPPVFMPGPAVETPSAPVAAPVPAPAPEAPQAAPAPVARPAPTPAPVAAPVAARSDYVVQRNDTLWGIAQRVRPDDTISTNQAMMALFNENPQAFDGNINRLRAGAILRVPSREQMAASSARDATAEVRRQTETWRDRTPAAAPVERRLELAPPVEAARPPAPVTETAREPAAPAPEVLEAVQELRGELADTRRLIEVKDAEIAALQARLAELEGAPVAPVDAQPEAAAPAPAAAPAEAPPAPAPAPAAPAPSLVDRILGLLGSLWLWLLVAIVVAAGAVVMFLRARKEQERSIEEDLAETGTWGTLETTGGKLAGAASGAAGGLKIEPRSTRSDAPGAIVVEESDAPAKPAAPAAPVAPVAPRKEPEAETSSDDEYQYPFEDTIAGESAVNLDQSDPMAEADFHMAYGLYDQAAEIIRKAVEREPDRYDLRRKLLDICFVWGNADEFLAQAKAIRALDDEAATTDWAKIGIMGRQICPGEAMFEAAGSSAVDLDVGIDDPGAPSVGAGAATSKDWLDFDVGASEGSSPALGDTREQPAPGRDYVAPDQTAELNIEELGMDLDLGATGEYALQDLADRAPEFPDEEDAGQAPGSAPDEDMPRSAEPVDEDADALPVPEDDGGTMMLESPKMRGSGDEPTQRGEGWELDDDEPPTVAGFGGYEDDEDEIEHTQIKKIEISQEGPTTAVSGFEDDDAELGLDELTQALKADVDLEEEAGESTRIEAEAEPVPEFQVEDTAEMPPSEMNEVATKLDLARAYLDMGDPDGARSILGEVVEEGNEAQREEARQLLDSLD